MTRVFVYGSLMTGLHNNRLLREGGARLVGPATIPAGRYAMVSLGAFPGLVDARWRDQGAASPIVGEIWEVDAMTLVRLDRLEGVEGGFYRRDWVPAVETVGGDEDDPTRVHIYVLCDGDQYDGDRLVPANDWRAYLKTVEDEARVRVAANRGAVITNHGTTFFGN
jgi:gamma-glutamylcyclotransferase (GGCT)/AIG2-like uncharacterized protein YtfP